MKDQMREERKSRDEQVARIFARLDACATKSDLGGLRNDLVKSVTGMGNSLRESVNSLTTAIDSLKTQVHNDALSYMKRESEVKIDQASMRNKIAIGTFVGSVVLTGVIQLIIKQFGG